MSKPISMDLLSQGWRLRPDNELMWTWVNQHPLNRWETMQLADGTQVARPTRLMRQVPESQKPHAYAHEGWGEGLTPTEEGVAIWRWWWYAGEPVSVRAVAGVGVVFSHPKGWNEPVQKDVKWGGPVLPGWKHSTV